MVQKTKLATALAAVALATGLASCESTTGPEGTARVAVAFRMTGPGASAHVGPAANGDPAGSLALQAIDVQGSNGTLSLDEMWFIVSEFELQQAEIACLGDDVPPSASLTGDDDEDGEGGDGEDDDGEAGEDDGDDDGCEEFEAPPSFVQLPLDGAAEPVVTQAVAPGLYRRLEFEIEDVEFDDDDDAGEVQALFDEVRGLFPDWHERASMLVTGSFTPAGGTPAPFRVFIDAEVEIVQEFDPPLDLTTGETATVTVLVDPAALFIMPDGSVRDLSQHDGGLIELEREIVAGFKGVESGDDGDSGDDGEDSDDGDDGDGGA